MTDQLYTVEFLSTLKRPELWAICNRRNLPKHASNQKCIETILASQPQKVADAVVQKEEDEERGSGRVVTFIGNQAIAPSGEVIAEIKYDDTDSFATQQYVVFINGVGVHPCNTQAMAQGWIGYHYKNGTLPVPLVKKVSNEAIESQTAEVRQSNVGVLTTREVDSDNHAVVNGGEIIANIKFDGSDFFNAKPWVAIALNGKEITRTDTFIKTFGIVCRKHRAGNIPVQEKPLNQSTSQVLKSKRTMSNIINQIETAANEFGFEIWFDEESSDPDRILVYNHAVELGEVGMGDNGWWVRRSDSIHQLKIPCDGIRDAMWSLRHCGTSNVAELVRLPINEAWELKGVKAMLSEEQLNQLAIAESILSTISEMTEVDMISRQSLAIALPVISDLIAAHTVKAESPEALLSLIERIDMGDQNKLVLLD